jgi:lipopolysaccharide transport system permease protein
MIWFGFDRRDLSTVWNFFKMFLRDRFLGSRLGAAWALLNPLLMLGIYTFVFGFVFKAKLPGADTTLAYSIWLIAGYGPWLAISESINSAAQSVVGNSGLVKNMAFKTECLPLAATMLGLVPLAISVVFAMVLMVFDGNPPTWHALAAIPGVAMIFLFLAAIGFGAAALAVPFRDFAMVLPNMLIMVLFASPIFYPIEAMPKELQSVAAWNPFYLLVEFVRQPVVYHRIPGVDKWLYMATVVAIAGSICLRLFRRFKGQFSSML